tara:strand:- start:452 stop:601 length:150 start_codon:yes stop_codon:yes gene_type:complete
MSGKQITLGLLNLIIDFTSYVEGKMDKYKLHLLLIFVGMIIGQIIRWVI